MNNNITRNTMEVDMKSIKVVGVQKILTDLKYFVGLLNKPLIFWYRKVCEQEVN